MTDGIVAQGFVLEIGPSGESPGALTEVKEVVDFSGFDGQASEIDFTHLQSSAKEFKMGLQDNGAFSVTVNYIRADAGQVEARAAKGTGTQKAFLVTLSDGSTFAFEGFVLASPLDGSVDAKVGSSFAVRITGVVVEA